MSLDELTTLLRFDLTARQMASSVLAEDAAVWRATWGNRAAERRAANSPWDRKEDKAN